MKLASVLVVEDNRADVQLMSYYFSQFRITNEMRVATSMAEARKALKEQSFNLVLADVRLPDGSGLDLAKEIRLSAAGDTHVVCMSAVADFEMVEEAHRAGVLGFIQKPLNTETLQALMRLLDKFSLAILINLDAPVEKIA